MDAGFDEIGNILEEEGGALSTYFILRIIASNSSGRRFCSIHLSAGRKLRCFADFVAPDVGESDGVEDVYFIDDPADLRFPVNGFEDTTRGGWCNDVVGDALDLHFRAGEEGVIAGDLEVNVLVGHIEGIFQLVQQIRD